MPASITIAWYGPITIRMENGGLVMSFDHTPGMIGDLQHWQYDTFKAHWRVRTIEDAFMTFSLNPDGSIDSARMAAVSPLADFSFDYQDLLLKPAVSPRRSKNCASALDSTIVSGKGDTFTFVSGKLATAPNPSLQAAEAERPIAQHHAAQRTRAARSRAGPATDHHRG